MKLSAFLAFAAAAFGVFGAGLSLAPGAFMRPFGLGFDPPGALMARVLGSALLGFALALWLSRDAGPAPVRPLLIGGLAYNLVDLPINVVAIQAGTMNALAWITVGLHVALAVGFGWFAFSRSAA